MAVAFDASSSGSASLTSSLTFSHTCSGTERVLIVGVVINANAASVSTVTYNSVSLTFIGSAINTGDTRVELWGLIAPSTGANNIVVTVSNSTSFFCAGGTSFTGADQTTAWNGLQTATGSSSAQSVTVTSATGNMVTDCVSTVTFTPTVGAGQTQRWSTSASLSNARGSTETGAASVTMSWTTSLAAEYALAAINIIQTSATRRVFNVS